MGHHTSVPKWVYRYILPTIVLPIQQVGFGCDTFPPWGLYKINYGSRFPFYVVLVTVHYTTILKCRFHTQLCVNNIEVTVLNTCACTIVFTINTCTCTIVFTIITAKDQSGGIYNGHSTGWSGTYAYSKQTSSSGYTLELCLFNAINLWRCAITITYLPSTIHYQMPEWQLHSQALSPLWNGEPGKKTSTPSMLHNFQLSYCMSSVSANCSNQLPVAK